MTSRRIALHALFALVVPTRARAQSTVRDTTSAPVVARNDPSAARAHYDRGRRFYLQGRFLEAAGEFRAAYEATRDPAFLYDAAMALYDGGNLSAARDTFTSYLREQPGTPNRAVIEQRIATIDRRLHNGAATSSLAPASAPPAETAAPTARAPLAWAGLAIGGAGLVAVAVGAGLYAVVDAQYRSCLPNRCDASEQPRALDAASVAMIWGGSVLALAGAAMFVFVPRVRASAAARAVAIDPRGGVSITLSF